MWFWKHSYFFIWNSQHAAGVAGSGGVVVRLGTVSGRRNVSATGRRVLRLFVSAAANRFALRARPRPIRCFLIAFCFNGILMYLSVANVRFKNHTTGCSQYGLSTSYTTTKSKLRRLEVVRNVFMALRVSKCQVIWLSCGGQVLSHRMQWFLKGVRCVWKIG